MTNKSLFLLFLLSIQTPMKKKAKEQSPELSDKLKEKFLQFIEYAPPARFSRSLRSLLLWYLIYEEEVPAFEMNELAGDLALLFELLDMAEDEYGSMIHRSEER